MTSLFPIVNTNDFAVPDVFDNFFNNFMWPADSSYNVPKVDIEDKGDAYVLTADMPGVAKEDINLTYDHDVLTLFASHVENNDEQDEQKNYIRKERMSTSFCRQFPVSGIQKEGIQASFENGVLTITLPKEEPQPAETQHTIEIQ